MTRLPACLLLTLFLLVSSGCNDFLAERMVAPPNGGRTSAAAPRTAEGMQIVQIPVGPPDATLAAWIYEPKLGTRPHGTVLALHGFINDHSQMQGIRKALCDAGFRTVLVDLRGHGASTGDYITYGVNDAHDLAQVTDYLQRHHLCGDSIGVYGASYGAATAIMYAGADPRVAAVVAVAPFATLREEAPYFGQHLLPLIGSLMTSEDYVQIVNKMGQDANFNPDEASALAAIKKTNAHIRLFHGDDDLIVPVQSSEELAAADPDRAEFTLMRGRGHFDLCFDYFGDLHAWSREWFERYLPVHLAQK